MPDDVELPPKRPARSSSAPEGASGAAIGVRIDRLRAGDVIDQDFAQDFAQEAAAEARLTLCYFGVIRVEIGADSWFVPSKHGIWTPPHAPFRLRAQTDVETHCLALGARLAQRGGAPREPVVVQATPLLRGVAQRLAPEAAARLSPAERRRLVWAALDELGRLDRPDLRLPGGSDPRLAAAMAHLIAHPEDRSGLAALARRVGSSERTLARLFAAETGLAFRDWRRRQRFMLALEHLAQGATSAALARRLGYASSSAFVAAFRAHFGRPPSAYRRPGASEGERSMIS